MKWSHGSRQKSIPHFDAIETLMCQQEWWGPVETHACTHAAIGKRSPDRRRQYIMEAIKSPVKRADIIEHFWRLTWDWLHKRLFHVHIPWKDFVGDSRAWAMTWQIGVTFVLRFHNSNVIITWLMCWQSLSNVMQVLKSGPKDNSALRVMPPI